MTHYPNWYHLTTSNLFIVILFYFMIYFHVFFIFFIFFYIFLDFLLFWQICIPNTKHRTITKSKTINKKQKKKSKNKNKCILPNKSTSIMATIIPIKMEVLISNKNNNTHNTPIIANPIFWIVKSYNRLSKNAKGQFKSNGKPIHVLCFFFISHVLLFCCFVVLCFPFYNMRFCVFCIYVKTYLGHMNS